MNRIDPKLAATLRQPAELIERGLAPAGDLADLERVAARYAIAVTPDIAGLIDSEDPDDPIARQFIPSARELVSAPGENADPIGDDAHSPVAGIVHRYPDRVLFKLVHVCAVYCRFCFRREMVGPGKATALSDTAYRDALAYIRGHAEIWEVILTGGDPLMLSPRRPAYPWPHRRGSMPTWSPRCGSGARPPGSPFMPTIPASLLPRPAPPARGLRRPAFRW
jgi:lysine 2,3-aminomutase